MSWTHARARLAAASRHHPGTDTTALRRELRAARLADAINRCLAQDPPLTRHERCALAALLLTDAPTGAAS